MKRNKIIAVLLAIVLAGGAGFVFFNKEKSINPDEIVIDGIPDKADSATRVMSFNVRYRDDKDGSVKNRSKIVSAIVKEYAPDSLGVQEATGRWMEILSESLADYACVGEHREEDSDSEHSAVFYLKDKFNLLDSGTIWLSDTPEEKYTKYEQSACIRIATWATLENKETGKVYTHINTHLDHVSDEARVMQANVLKSKIAELEKSGNPVFCTGDFNAEPESDVYTEMVKSLNDSKAIAKSSDDGITFHDYGKIQEGTAGPIDYIFATKDIKASVYKIIRNRVTDMYPSDHYPVVADFLY